MAKVKAVHVAFNHGRGPAKRRSSHIAIVDTKKRVWERFSGDPDGQCGSKFRSPKSRTRRKTAAHREFRNRLANDRNPTRSQSTVWQLVRCVRFRLHYWTFVTVSQITTCSPDFPPPQCVGPDTVPAPMPRPPLPAHVQDLDPRNAFGSPMGGPDDDLVERIAAAVAARLGTTTRPRADQAESSLTSPGSLGRRSILRSRRSTATMPEPCSCSGWAPDDGPLAGIPLGERDPMSLTSRGRRRLPKLAELDDDPSEEGAHPGHRQPRGDDGEADAQLRRVEANDPLQPSRGDRRPGREEHPVRSLSTRTGLPRSLPRFGNDTQVVASHYAWRMTAACVRRRCLGAAGRGSSLLDRWRIHIPGRHRKGTRPDGLPTRRRGHMRPAGSFRAISVLP